MYLLLQNYHVQYFIGLILRNLSLYGKVLRSTISKIPAIHFPGNLLRDIHLFSAGTADRSPIFN